MNNHKIFYINSLSKNPAIVNKKLNDKNKTKLISKLKNIDIKKDDKDNCHLKNMNYFCTGFYL